MAGNDLIEKKIDELTGVDKIPPPKPHSRLIVWLTAACVLILIIAGITLVITPQPAASEPQGKITAPASIAETGRKIQITGYTKNLPPDRMYVLINKTGNQKGMNKERWIIPQFTCYPGLLKNKIKKKTI